MNLKDKKLPFIAGGAAVIIILLLLIFMPSKKSEEGPEVISKRVKIEVPADGAAPIDSTTDAAASADAQVVQAPVQGVPPAVQAPAPAPEVKPAPVQPRQDEVKPAPVQVAPKRVEEPVKAAKAPVKKEEAPKVVKAEKKKPAEKTKKVAEVSKRLLADNAWVINLASFPNLSEAQSLAGKLKKAGYKAYVVKFKKESVQWHRVRVGFFPSRDAAVKTGRAIKSKFNLDQPWVTKPDRAEISAHM